MSFQGITKHTTDSVIKEISKVLIGQPEFLQVLIICLFSGGHVLIEGVPGLGKTLAARALAEIADVEFRRIQFTPDMMPSDITGINIFDLKAQSFQLKKGPLFTNFLLADEINRTPAKTQSALLESMEEQRVTIDGMSYNLQNPFMVIATQNPIEFEGTYPLPEAQLDRFLMKLLIDYPEENAETDLLRKYNQGFNAKDFGTMNLNKVMDAEIIGKCKEEIQGIKVDESIITYIISIITATRKSPNLLLGSSPRGSIALLNTGKTLAAMEGRDYVIPDDIQSLALPVLRHRLVATPESEIQGVGIDHILMKILNDVKVPR